MPGGVLQEPVLVVEQVAVAHQGHVDAARRRPRGRHPVDPQERVRGGAVVGLRRVGGVRVLLDQAEEEACARRGSDARPGGRRPWRTGPRPGRGSSRGPARARSPRRRCPAPRRASGETPARSTQEGQAEESREERAQEQRDHRADAGSGDLDRGIARSVPRRVPRGRDQRPDAARGGRDRTRLPRGASAMAPQVPPRPPSPRPRRAPPPVGAPSPSSPDRGARRRRRRPTPGTPDASRCRGTGWRRTTATRCGSGGRRGPEEIRLLGVDAPEVEHLAHDIPSRQPFGERAAGFLQGALAVAHRVEILRAPTPTPTGAPSPTCSWTASTSPRSSPGPASPPRPGPLRGGGLPRPGRGGAGRRRRGPVPVRLRGSAARLPGPHARGRPGPALARALPRGRGGGAGAALTPARRGSPRRWPAPPPARYRRRRRRVGGAPGGRHGGGEGPRDRRGRLHRERLRAPPPGRGARDPGPHLRPPHLRRPPREPRGSRRPRTATRSCGATSPTPRRSAAAFAGFRPTAVVNLAAESHVDQSLPGGLARSCARTWSGTQVLLDACRARRGSGSSRSRPTRSTGASPPRRPPAPDDPLAPTSPYAASKAAADLLVHAAHQSHGQDALVTRCTNNYGPRAAPGEADPPDDAAGAGGRGAAGLRRREAGPRLDPRRRPRRGDPRRPAAGPVRRGLPLRRAHHASRTWTWSGRSSASRGRPGATSGTWRTGPAHDRRYALDDAATRQALGWAPRVGFEQGSRGHGRLVPGAPGLVPADRQRRPGGFLERELRPPALRSGRTGRRAARPGGEAAGRASPGHGGGAPARAGGAGGGRGRRPGRGPTGPRPTPPVREPTDGRGILGHDAPSSVPSWWLLLVLGAAPRRRLPCPPGGPTAGPGLGRGGRAEAGRGGKDGGKPGEDGGEEGARTPSPSPGDDFFDSPDVVHPGAGREGDPGRGRRT